MADRIDVHVHIHLHTGADEARVTALEEAMASEVEQLDALRAEFEAFVADVNAKIDALSTAQGGFSVEGQAAFDALKSSVDAAATALGDVNADGVPAPEPTP